jgi:LysM repeat protein
MDQGESQISVGARLAAAAALAVAVAVVLVVLAGTLSNGDGGPAGGVPDNGTSAAESGSKRVAGPATYKIREGDTLSAIADETGVSVARIEDLNPGLDPQAITPGQKIRLR